jgi:hypothetical protein
MQADFLTTNKAYVLAALLALAVAGFSLTRNPAFAVAGFVILLALVLHDITPSKWNAKELKRTAVELVIALALAIGVWMGLQLVLNNSTPVDVVTSCSMLPNLERGDMIIVQGKEPKTTQINFTGTLADLETQLRVVKEPCILRESGVPVQAACTQAVVYKGRQYPMNPSNDVIVFDAEPRFYGLIVHRAFARLSNGTDSFYLTKGDNNLGIDQEAGFSPVSARAVKGTVVSRVPYVGFLKLFLFMQFDEPQGCKQLLAGGE